MNLSSIDLNLLLVLSVVLEERSATRAARRLNVTQSAVSNALGRLREILDDPLLVRSGRGLVPTPRALELAPLLGSAMAQLEAAVTAKPVDPRTTTRQFTVAGADAQQIHDVPSIAAAMADEMPRATLRVVSIDFLIATDGLATGEVDLLLGPPTVAEGLHYQKLYLDEPVAIARKKHPEIRGRLTKRLFNSVKHVDLQITMGRPGTVNERVQQVLAKQGLLRQIALSVPSFVSAIMVAAHTDYVAAVPRRLAESLAPHLPVQVLELPARNLAVENGMLWHPRTDSDPVSKLFRRVVARALEDEKP